MTIRIQRWWANKNLSVEELDAIELSGAEPEVVEEGEKSFQIRWTTKFGDIVKWVPKKLCMSEEELEEHLKKHFAERAEKLDSYTRLYEWAKSQGVAVTRGMKFYQLVEKIESTGLDVPDEFRKEDSGGVVYRSKEFMCYGVNYPAVFIWDSASRQILARVNDSGAGDERERDRAEEWCSRIRAKARNLEAANKFAEEYGTYFPE